jgi:hypothetical protein
VINVFAQIAVTKLHILTRWTHLILPAFLKYLPSLLVTRTELYAFHTGLWQVLAVYVIRKFQLPPPPPPPPLYLEIPTSTPTLFHCPKPHTLFRTSIPHLLVFLFLACGTIKMLKVMLSDSVILIGFIQDFEEKYFSTGGKILFCKVC